MPKVTVRRVENKQLMAVSRHHAVVLDLPAEREGTDLGFTPTELLLSALGSCMTFNLIHYAQRSGLPVRGIEVELTDTVSSGPERISRVRAEIRVTGDLTEEELARLLRSARGCKIHNTLSHPPQVEVSLAKGGGAE